MSRGHGWGLASCVSSGESWVCLVFVTCGIPQGFGESLEILHGIMTGLAVFFRGFVKELSLL